MLVPRQSVPLLSVAKQTQIGLDLIVHGRRRVLGIIEDVNFSVDSLGGNNFGVLRHVPSLVDFALVVDLDVDLDARLL